MSKEALDKVTGILGEHFRNYVVIASDDESPLAYDVRFSDPYAAKGLLESATEYHESFITGGTPDDLDGIEWITIEEEEDEDDETEYYE
mgnify:CR=1 FL=1|tara:strand:+ start:763 stop:1029 length:267 start_codon:yes stop_codon:yes gene_type:complete